MKQSPASGTAGLNTASGFRTRIQEASDALRSHLGALPTAQPEAGKLKTYIISVGEALACHDEIKVLRQLVRQKGFEPVPEDGGQDSIPRLRDRLQEMLSLMQNPLLRQELHSLGGAELARAIPELSPTRKSPQAILLRREEEKLKSSYARLMPLPGNLQSAKAELGTVPLPRAARKKDWLDQARVWEERGDALEQLFTELVDTRKRLALALGFDSYAGYLAHRRRGMSWLPEQFLRLTAEITFPLLRSLHEYRKAALGLTRLRPFDLSTRNIVGALDFPQWRKSMERLMENVHPYFAECFRVMTREGLVDLRSAHAGTCLHLQHSRRPYVQAPAGISPKELMAAIHEIGHGIHILFAAGQEIPFYRGITPLSGELAALSVELLASPHLEAFFEDPAVAARVRRKHLEGIVAVFSTATAIESFEEELYSKEMSAATRQKTFAGIMEKHLGLIDYTGYEAILRTWYHRIPTLVFSPGYFLYYAVAQAGALSVCRRAGRSGEISAEFMRFMRLGTRFTDERLYEAAGASPSAMVDSLSVEQLGKTLYDLYHAAPLT